MQYFVRGYNDDGQETVTGPFYSEDAVHMAECNLAWRWAHVETIEKKA